MEPITEINLSTSSPNFWTRSERRLWLWVMLLGCIAVYAARTVMPVCVIPISEEFGWNKTDSDMLAMWNLLMPCALPVTSFVTVKRQVAGRVLCLIIPGTALSAFFWGYSTTQILGGYLGDRFGGDKVICLSVTGWALITIMTPVVVKLGSESSALGLFVVTRALAGCFQGVHFPSLASLFSKKVSEAERGFSFSFSTSGNHFGTILNGCVGSLLLQHVGWSYSFYAIGFLGLLWVAVVHLRLLDQTSIDVSESTLVQEKVIEPKLPQKLPWVKLLTASPFWAVVLCQFCSSWSFYILLSWIPTYFHDNFSTAKGWVFNVVPWALAIPFQWGSGLMADVMIARGWSTTFTRKFIQSISFGCSGLFLFLLTSAETFNGALLYMSLTVAFLAFNHGGLAVNVQDIAPDYAGSVFGMMNTAGAIPGFVGVYVTGYILDTTHSWDIIFRSTAAVCWTGWVIFTLFATGRRIV